VLGNGVVDGVRGTGVRGVRGIGSSIGVEGVAQGGIAVLGSTTSGKGVQGNSSTSTGVEGGSASGPGVHGLSQNGIGVVGRQWNHGTGVAGFSLGSIETILTGKAKTGVYGEALQDSASRGVWGRSGAGQGTRGEATSGIGVYGIASTGYAFRGSGRLRFDKVSGVATIPAGSTSVTITPGVDINSASFVLLTSKTNLSSRSLYYSTDATNNRFTIRLSSSRTSSTVVAWLLVG
jgi:hypothetical protein